MPELSATLAAKRDVEHTQQKFMAALQGVDIDKGSGEAITLKDFAKDVAHKNNKPVDEFSEFGIDYEISE